MSAPPKIRESVWGGSWPCAEICLAAAMLVGLLVALGMLTGCADSGSRGQYHDARNRHRVRTLTLVMPTDAKPHETDWAIETLEEHLKLLDRHRHASMVAQGFYPVEVVVYRTTADVQSAHVAYAQQVGHYNAPPFITPNMTGSGVFLNGRVSQGFITPTAIHMSVGDRWEGGQWGHLLWHLYEDRDLTHRDARWRRLDFDDYLLSTTLWASR